MKKIFLAIFVSFILLSAFLFFPLNANAQQYSIPVRGVNCGIAGDISMNKCCAPFKLQLPTSIEDIAPDFGSPWRVVTDLAFGAIQKMTQKYIGPVADFNNKMLIPCEVGTASTTDPSDVNCRCMISGNPTSGPIESLKKFCTNQTRSGDKTNCNSCVIGGGVWTGIGCVQGSINEFVGQTVFGLGIGLAGGFSLLCIIYAAFMMQSSQGNPEKLKKAQEMITSCIMGLMLIIFSVFILKLIGVNILKIPGFG